MKFNFRKWPIVLAMLAMVACDGGEEDGVGPNDGGDNGETTIGEEISAAPTSFDQKVVIEELTGAWCGWCTDGAYVVEQTVEDNPGLVIPVGVHGGDPMEISAFMSLMSNDFGGLAYPTAMVNRLPAPGGNDVLMGRGSWAAAAEDILSKNGGKTDIGLALQSEVSGDSLKLRVNVGFGRDYNESIVLNVYLLDDSIIESGDADYHQVNYLANNSNYVGNPYYSQPDPIVGFEHKHVLIDVLTALNGDAIGVADTREGGTFQQDFTYILDDGTDSYTVVAFVTKSGDEFEDRQIINAQAVKAGQTQDW